ncbi:MAG: M20 family metallopeptidase [Asgard group archaeon]|nr:M20 family metallopeptidase [Asgard group archaeon]
MSINSIIKRVNSDLIKEITKNLVEMDSQNPPGKCSHIVKYLIDIGKELGFQTKIYEIDKDRQNVVLTYGEGSRDIVLSGHLDTVPIGDESKWKYPPLEMTDVNDKLFGRGTVDMKGGVASLIAVMDAISRSEIELDHRIVFAGTADEEVGMHGAFHLKEKGLMENAECLIITEATNLKVGIAEKGPIWIRVNINGKAAHGSVPEEGVNAIYGACVTLNELKNNLPIEQNELLGNTTLNVGIIQGGSKINIVPDFCFFDCDYRLIPEVNQKIFLNSITELLDSINSKNAFNANYELNHEIPAIGTNQEEPIVKSMLKWAEKITGQKTNPVGLTYATDAAALIPPQKTPFIILGGGSPSVLHKTNEYVYLSDLVKAAKIITGGILDAFQPK